MGDGKEKSVNKTYKRREGKTTQEWLYLCKRRKKSDKKSDKT